MSLSALAFTAPGWPFLIPSFSRFLFLAIVFLIMMDCLRRGGGTFCHRQCETKYIPASIFISDNFTYRVDDNSSVPVSQM
ncbi:hypothetical protein BC827DRAFT_1185182, partial [Russula dissimulans]